MNTQLSAYFLALAGTALLSLGCAGSEAPSEPPAAADNEQAEPIATGDFEGGTPAIDGKTGELEADVSAGETSEAEGKDDDQDASHQEGDDG